MATYNFHFRVIPPPQEGSGALQHWFNDHLRAYTTTVYDVSEELFVLYPRMNFTINKSPTNTTTNLYQFRVAKGQLAINTPNLETNVYDLNFGNLNISVPNKMVLYFGFPTDPLEPIDYSHFINLTNSAWTNSNWTLSNISTFKNEISTFIAKCCDNSRLRTGFETEPLSNYSDFAVQIYKDGFPSLISSSFVVFYPGNDPEAEDIVTVVT
jgi:hypothetical protein